MENKIKLNAEAFERLLNIEYYFCLAYKGKGFEVRVRFAEEDFHHLEGIGQLRDLQIHSESGNVTFDKALDGMITQVQLEKSNFFEKSYVQNKIDYLHLLERAFDENRVVFRFRNEQSKSKIESELFLNTLVDGQDIYVYLDMVAGTENEYFCRSFVANPDFDRTAGQTKLTTLWQEKIDLCTGESHVIYRYKNFITKDLKK